MTLVSANIILSYYFICPLLDKDGCFFFSTDELGTEFRPCMVVLRHHINVRFAPKINGSFPYQLIVGVLEVPDS